MTSKELVYKTLEFNKPARVPRHMWTLPWTETTYPAGLDALNSQIFCMGVEEVGRQFRGKIAFWGEIDRQHILPEGTKEDVQNAVRLVHESLYADGGMIAQCEFGPGAKPENVYAGFGIDFILFYKHMDKTRVRGDEFWWESPDGSRAMATHLGREARWNFFLFRICLDSFLSM